MSIVPQNLSYGKRFHRIIRKTEGKYVTFSCLFRDLLDNGTVWEYTIIIRDFVPLSISSNRKRNAVVLNITILSVGTIKEKYLTDALKEYIKRLGAYARVTEVQCKDEHLSENPSAGEIRTAIEKEGKKLLDALPKRAYVCALCIEGKQCSSEQFAARLDALAVDGHSDIAFIIGGSDGLSDEVKARADWKLSFSQMTFPHQLMRVILCEQLYRAMNILGGGKYHK